MVNIKYGLLMTTEDKKYFRLWPI